MNIMANTQQPDDVRRQRIVAALRAEALGYDLIKGTSNMWVYGVLEDNNTLVVLGVIPFSSWYQMSDEERSMVVGKLKFGT